VQTRALLMKLGLGPLGLGLALGDPRALLGLGGLTLTRLGLGTVLVGDLLAAVLQLALTLLDLRSRAHAREDEGEKSDDDQGCDNDGDDRACRHDKPP
jgi:hypothetical protein